MTDDQAIDLSRRTLLAGLGGIGVASAGAALGTSAYFSDQETFQGNSLSAGQLVLEGSWQQTYYGAPDDQRPQDYGTAGRPWVNAFPDDTENGIQSLGERAYVDDPSTDPADGTNLQLSCADFSDVGEAPRPVVGLDDVKPGDSGEVTFGLNLCDNPGYLWMDGELQSESEGQGGGQLAEYLWARVWRDANCDNVRQDIQPTDVALLLDVSGSMFYEQYGGVVSDDPVTIGNSEYGETSHDETTKIDLVEQGIVDFVDLLADEIDDNPEIDQSDLRIGAVFFDGYEDDEGNQPVLGVEDFASPIEDLVDLNGGDAPLRNLRDDLSDLVGGGDDVGDGGGITTGTALEEGIERVEQLFDDRTDDSRKPESLTVTDGEPWLPGDAPDDDRYEGVLDAADSLRSGGSVQSSIFVIGDETSESEAVFTKQVIAGPAGLGIDVAGAVSAGFGGDPTAYGGDPSFFFDLNDPVGIPNLFAQIAVEILPEDVLTAGTLRDVLDHLQGDPGVPLDADPRFEGYACFDPGVTHCIGFEWEFPIRSTDPGADLDNDDAQGASLEFDLGFYAEQCRHNEGPNESEIGEPT